MNAAPASSQFSLTVVHGSPGPALLALPGRVDRVELVELATSETVLVWEGHPMEAARLARALRRDMRRLDSGEFRSAWVENEEEPPGA